MPIYEYQCCDCETPFEFLHLKKEDKAECPQCKSVNLNRVLSVVSGHVSKTGSASCPPADAPPCNPHCCRLK